MLGQIYHVGLTVSNLEKSIAFYRDILKLEYKGQILMQGPSTSKLFNRENCIAKVAYLNGSKELNMPPIELIEFVDTNISEKESDLFRTSISEVCFYTDDIHKFYEHLQKHNVECLSPPQFFDFTQDGFSKSYAFYFKDIDGIILEVMQNV